MATIAARAQSRLLGCGRPYLDSIVVSFTPDEGARAVALEAGELALAGGLPVALPDAALKRVPTLEIPTKGYEALAHQVFMELNVRKPYFKDARVRQAIYHAIDRDFCSRTFGTISARSHPARSRAI